MRGAYLTTTVLLLAGCGGTDTTNPNPTGPATITGAGTAGSFSVENALMSAEPIQQLGQTSAGTILSIINNQTYEVEAGELVHRPLFVDMEDPRSTGNVHHIAPRAEGGAWLSADAGLFIFDELFVTRSPLLSDAGTVWSVQELAAGPLAGLWIGADDGLHKRTETLLQRFTVEGASGAATRLALEPQGRAAIAIIGDALVILEDDAGQLVSFLPELDTGAINAVAATSGALFVAGAEGLFRYTLGAEWTRFTLSDEGQPATAALGLSADAATGALWIRTADQLLELRGDSLTHFAMSGGSSALTVDRFGDVWAAEDEGLSRKSLGAQTGERSSFATDVLPWVMENCSQCHSNQTQNFEDYEVFRGISEGALARVRSGDMPRCEGGVRCAPEEAMSPEQYAVLEQWLRDGTPE